MRPQSRKRGTSAATRGLLRRVSEAALMLLERTGQGTNAPRGGFYRARHGAGCAAAQAAARGGNQLRRARRAAARGARGQTLRSWVARAAIVPGVIDHTNVSVV